MKETILEARYADETNTTIYVMLENEEGQVYEEYIEYDELPYSRYNQLELTEELLIENTAEFKRQSRAQWVRIAKEVAFEEYNRILENRKGSIEKWNAKRVDAQAKAVNAQLKLDKITEKLAAINEYADTRNEDAIMNIDNAEMAIDKFLTFVRNVNDDSRATNELAKQLGVEVNGRDVIQILKDEL